MYWHALYFEPQCFQSDSRPVAASLKNNKMHICGINGTSFVGKSTLLKQLHTRLPGKCAVLDGDDVGRIFPYEISRQWLDLIQNNILSCALNFKAAGVDFFLFAFPFPAINSIDRLNAIFLSQGHAINWINLIASDSTLEARFRARGGTKPENLRRGLDMNRAITQLPGFFTMDTTGLTPDEVAEAVLEYMRKSMPSGG